MKKLEHTMWREKKLPSVTTIISATQSEEKRKALCNWRQRVGQEQATRITIDAARRGTEMHLVLEKYCQGKPYFNTNSYKVIISTNDGSHNSRKFR